MPDCSVACVYQTSDFSLVVGLPATSNFLPFMTLMLSVRQRVYPAVQLLSGLGFISVFIHLKIELLFSPLGKKKSKLHSSLLTSHAGEIRCYVLELEELQVARGL